MGIYGMGEYKYSGTCIWEYGYVQRIIDIGN